MINVTMNMFLCYTQRCYLSPDPHAWPSHALCSPELPPLRSPPCPRYAMPLSAALVGALHLMTNNTEIVKRWINEIQEAAQNKNNMVQVCVTVQRAPRG